MVEFLTMVEPVGDLYCLTIVLFQLPHYKPCLNFIFNTITQVLISSLTRTCTQFICFCPIQSSPETVSKLQQQIRQAREVIEQLETDRQIAIAEVCDRTVRDRQTSSYCRGM
ncbi:hypothetical protein DPMN_018758 [Dreissena polymorpha]|uniref:Uncharacterized protein n=1 Tax=Dreissena polymorpha TaxID=45954 RepID=A0A9D4S7L1_DREPO|nr:hypothetical protein DPMN_018758 [Dreissena polymorpha]